MWCIGEITPEYENKMLDVLEVYERPYDPKKPQICIDEKSKQLLSRERTPKRVKKGKSKRVDYEYVRHGTVNIFTAVEPKGKKRYVRVTKRRTAQDFARYLENIVMKKYREAQKVVLVLDNLNTHFETSISEALPKERAEKLLRRIEFHYTPTHASWLDMAEIEISALSRQLLKRDIPTFQNMQHHVACWERDRNRKDIGITWQFTREKARKKFRLGMEN